MLIILAAALALRIYIVFFYADSWIVVDSENYIIQAEMLLDGKYPAYFPNGYPLVISLFLFLAGNVYTASLYLVILNIILSVIIVYLVYKISFSLYSDEKLALIAAMIVSVYPNQLNYIRFVLTEVPAAFLLILSLYLLQKTKYKFAAFTAGFASIIRTTFFPLGILFSLYLIKKREYRKGSIYLIYFLMPVCALMFYGFIISGELTMGNNSFHNLTLTAYDLEGVDFVDAQTSLNQYLAYAINDPVKFLKDRFFSLLELWGPHPSLTKWEKTSLHYRLFAGLRFPLLMLALYGFIKLPGNKEKIFIILAVLVLTTVHFFYFPNPRFTVPIEPLMVILAVKGLEEAYYKLFNKQRKSLARQK